MLLASVVVSVLLVLLSLLLPVLDVLLLVELVSVLDDDVVVELDPVPSSACKSLLTTLAALCASLVLPDETELSSELRSLRNWLTFDVVPAEELDVVAEELMAPFGGGGGGGLSLLVRLARSCSTLCAADWAVVVSPDWTALNRLFKSVRNWLEFVLPLELDVSALDALLVALVDDPRSVCNPAKHSSPQIARLSYLPTEHRSQVCSDPSGTGSSRTLCYWKH